MIIFKILLALLLCIPIGYLGIRLIGKLSENIRNSMRKKPKDDKSAHSNSRAKGR